MSADTMYRRPGQLPGLIIWLSSTLLFAGSAAAQTLPVKIEVGPNIRVSDAGVPHVELYIAAHPDNPRNLIVSAAHLASAQDSFVETFFTSDGGKTWPVSYLPQSRELVARKEASGPAGDSAVAFAPDGTAYCSMLLPMSRGHAWGRLPVLVYRSRDQGRSWEGPTAIGPFFDRPGMVAAGAGKDKRLYVAAMGITSPSEPAGVAILRSDDDGASFQRTVLTPDNLGHNAANPVVTPEGLLIVPYVDFPSTHAERGKRQRQLVHAWRIYVVASRDQGRSFGPPQIVADIPRYPPSLPVMAIDLSPGRFRGRFYLSWNGESDDRQNVTVALSQDNGETWSANAIKAPDAGPAHFSSVAVSNNGTLGVTWIQYEREESRRKCWRTYFAASVNGGESFSPPVVISSVPSCLDPAANKVVLAAFPYLGCVIGLTAAADGVFHAAWYDARDGALQVYTARIAVRFD